jgi:large subunit ribosomal protein L9
MKVILREDVPSLGSIGQMVNVKSGFARNYLLPNGLALLANEKNMCQLEHQKRLIERHKVKIQQDAKTLAEKIQNMSCTIPVLVGEQDKIFGSVTSKDIEEALSQEGMKISRKQIVLDEPIKSLGVYTVDVRLHAAVIGKLKVWVVAK